ncbi:MAG: hypothetical protein K9K64_12830 [Desulfohalobiaceae bacterium]|nr:hypothetical protein [Desulfohalobiaceae bacterium]
MAYEQSIRVIDNRVVEAVSGPMRLTIQAWKGKEPRIEQARQAAAASFGFLERIAALRFVLSKPAAGLREWPRDELAVQMIDSTLRIGDQDLTPMAAVAGTMADAVADRLWEHDLDKVIVENGGDVSIRLSPKERVEIGLRPRVESPEISHILVLDAEQPSWGVTTSGFGGRSLTRGIASAVICVAERAAVADAASTAIANACRLDDEKIIQVPAETLDPDTDIPGIPVTLSLGDLGPETWHAAGRKGSARAGQLIEQGVLRGNAIYIGREMLVTGWLAERIRNY